VYVLLVLRNLKRLRSWTGSPSTQCRGRIRASSHVSKAARRHPSAPDRPLLGWGWAATCCDCSAMPLWHIPARGLRRGVDRALPTPESPEAPGLPCQVVAAGRPISSLSTCNFRCGTNPTPLLESEHLATLQRTRRGQAPCYHSQHPSRISYFTAPPSSIGTKSALRPDHQHRCVHLLLESDHKSHCNLRPGIEFTRHYCSPSLQFPREHRRYSRLFLTQLLPYVRTLRCNFNSDKTRQDIRLIKRLTD
jgi:hypothetical protein